MRPSRNREWVGPHAPGKTRDAANVWNVGSRATFTSTSSIARCQYGGCFHLSPRSLISAACWPYLDAIRRSRNRNEGLPKGGRSRLCRLASASHGFLHLLKSPADRPSFPSYSDSQTSVAALHSAFACSPCNWLLALVEIARRRLIYSSGLFFRMPESVIRFVSSAVRPLRHH